MTKFDPIAQFNSGKGFKMAASGTADEGSYNFYVQSSELVLGKFKDRDGKDQYQLNIIVGVDDPEGKISKGDLFTTIYQNVKFTEDGAMKNPAYPAFKVKSGEEIPASQLYEILHAAKEFDETAYEAAKKEALTKTGDINWVKFLKGLKFSYAARIGDRKDGSGKYVMLLTPKQIKKDEEYQAQRSAPAAEDLPEVTSVADTNGKIDVDDLPF